MLIHQGYNLNFRSEFALTEFDRCVTPLAAASYLGRTEMVGLMITQARVDTNLATEEYCSRIIILGFTP